MLLLALACRTKDLVVDSALVDSDCTPVTGYLDADGDGFGSGEPFEDCELPSDHVEVDGDCDDAFDTVYPGAPEDDCTDPVDYNCDGSVGYADEDGDGFAACEDCDDADAAVNPDADEVCDTLDNDCDGDIDEPDAVDALTWYADTDSDGFGDLAAPQNACEQPAEHVADATDCDDAVSEVNPDATEVCNTIDDDCDGTIDEDDAADASTWYADTDEDTHGDPAVSLVSCDAPEGYVASDDDCDDTDADTFSGATEVTADEVDQDCDGGEICYADADNDGYHDGSTTVVSADTDCIDDGEAAATEDDGECDDTDATIHPNATEGVGDEVDQDCDGGEICYADSDDDGFSDDGGATVTSSDTDCQDSTEATSSVPDTDCDDGDSAINPDATEVCDSVDNDCDGTTDEDDAWWDSGWSYRVPLTLTAASVDVDGPPVLVEVDFAAALSTLGASGTFAEDSLRVVVQDCSLSQPELTSQFMDTVVNLGDDADHEDASSDSNGTVAFLYDTDGDVTTLETLTASSTLEVALYFDTTGTAPAYSHGLTVSTTGLANDETTITLSASDGGLMDAMTWGSTQISSQTDSCCGNGSYVSSWANTPMYVTGTTTVIESGPVVGLVESTSSMTGYDATYWYWLFDGRPELYGKTLQVATATTSTYHGAGFGDGVRPWETRQDAISGSATFTTDSSYAWSDVNNGSLGLTFAWVSEPAYGLEIDNYDPYLIVKGNDLSSSTATTWPLANGDIMMDHPSWLVLPYSGTANAEANTVTALVEGVSVSAGTPESY